MFNKSRLSIPVIFLSLSLVAMGCSSSPSGTNGNEGSNGNNNNGGNGSGDPAEPTLSIGDLTDGAEASGDLVFTINGEAGEGFAELRILLGEEEIASASDPAMPYEQTLQTFAYDNGDYELTVELDVAGGDSTLSETVAVHFENYLMRIDADDYVRDAVDHGNRFTLYISDPEGNILTTTELNGSNGMAELVPPEAFEGESPEYINITFTEEIEGEINHATTYTGIKPWEAKWDGFGTGNSNDAPDTDKDLRVEISEPPVTPFLWGAVSENSNNSNMEPEGDVYPVSLQVASEDNNLLSFLAPNPEAEDNIPWYHWEKDLQSLELSDGETIQYKGSEFKKMSVHDIAHSSDLDIIFYDMYLSADAASWSAGSLWMPFITPSHFDQNAGSSTFGLVYPESDHRYDLTMIMLSKSNPYVQHLQQTTEALPGEIHTLNAEVDPTGLQNFEELSLDFSGSFDYARLQVDNLDLEEQDRWSWSVYMSGSQTSFTPPKILDEPIWGSLSVLGMEYMDLAGMDGYEDYLAYNWYGRDLEVTGYYSKVVDIKHQEKRKAAGPGGFGEFDRPEHLTIEERLRPLGRVEGR